MEELISNTNILSADIKEIKTGNFIKDGYLTYKVTIRAPDTAKVDVDSYSLYILLGKKPKVFPIVKDAPELYVKDFQLELEKILKETSANELLKQCQSDYDQVLLRPFKYFKRYQAVDHECCTILRYLFKSVEEIE
ncbi:hypothetical protein SS50377_22933 [Spironucleus salmonicida]|uniref:Uncharacterized protein n=1 Tax=Spironucleus salmonicida TaxID=348837 RepID=V6LWW5_9EUKA|nr:hypothetical protein SS50377_22933 [Spironucleus salmonicida]|eukprot:EST49080.1 hypothetical protein SS50377_10658 [Spironucleus salmonicida]